MFREIKRTKGQVGSPPPNSKGQILLTFESPDSPTLKEIKKVNRVTEKEEQKSKKDYPVDQFKS
jgi:hypothetical protein